VAGGAVVVGGGGGGSKTLVIGGVAAAGVAGVLTAARGDSDTPTPSTTRPNAPPVAPSPTAPSTPAPPPPGSSLTATCQANPRSGAAPLRVEFATFPTGGGGSYEFEWSFGDGDGSRNPNPAHIYVSPGQFEAVVRVTSGAETVSCGRVIEVTAAPSPVPGGPVPTPSPTAVPTPTPTPTPTPPPPPLMRTLTATTVGGNFPGTVSSSPGGLNCNSFPPHGVCAWQFAHGTSVTISGASFILAQVVLSGGCSASGTGFAQCTLVMDADKTVNGYFFRSSAQGSAPAMTLASDLRGAGAEGAVVMNGGPAFAARQGPAEIAGPMVRGANRVEAVLARGSAPGAWSFDLAGVTGYRPGSLRVTAGRVASITPDAVVFRLDGKPGERVAFTFEVD
jgi:hypothetical protein